MNIETNMDRVGAIYTFEADSTVEVGTLVKFVNNYKVTACENGDDFHGICVNARDGFAAVQIDGCAEILYFGDINLGYQKLSAFSSTRVSVSENGKEHLVMSVGASFIGILL